MSQGQKPEFTEQGEMICGGCGRPMGQIADSRGGGGWYCGYSDCPGELVEPIDDAKRVTLWKRTPPLGEPDRHYIRVQVPTESEGSYERVRERIKQLIEQREKVKQWFEQREKDLPGASIEVEVFCDGKNEREHSTYVMGFNSQFERWPKCEDCGSPLGSYADSRGGGGEFCPNDDCPGIHKPPGPIDDADRISLWSGTPPLGHGNSIHVQVPADADAGSYDRVRERIEQWFKQRGVDLPDDPIRVEVFF